MLKQPELKGSTFTLSVLHLVDDNFAAAADVLAEKVTQAPVFFEGRPVVLMFNAFLNVLTSVR